MWPSSGPPFRPTPGRSPPSPSSGSPRSGAEETHSLSQSLSGQTFPLRITSDQVF